MLATYAIAPKSVFDQPDRCHSNQKRQEYVHQIFSRLEWAVATPSVLSVGRGAAADLTAYVESYSFSRLQIAYADFALASRQGRQPPGGRWLPATYHLIWAPDLWLLRDRQTRQQLLAQLRPLLHPAGKLVMRLNLPTCRCRP